MSVEGKAKTSAAASRYPSQSLVPIQTELSDVTLHARLES